MAVKGNSLDQKAAETSQFKLYTGVAMWRVVGINPDQDGLKELGYKAEKAPVYFDPEKGRRIVFMLASVDGTMKANLAFFLKGEKVPDLWINELGNFGKDRTKLSGNLRNPYKGEVDLLMFIGDWLDVKKGEDLNLSTIDSIVNSGNLAELLDLFKTFKGNVFKGLAYVREGKYQSVYRRKTEKGWSKTSQYIHKSLAADDKREGDFGPINFSVFNENDFLLREYVANAAASGGSTATQSAGTSSGAAATAGAPAATEENPW